MKDTERIERIQHALRQAGLTAVVCSLPSNVLLLTGYWPVVGTAIAICVCDGPTVLLVPEDEIDLARAGFADSIEPFVAETLDEISTVAEAVKPHLAHILKQLNIQHGLVGVESGAGSQAASYLAVHLYGEKLSNLVKESLSDSKLTPIDEWIMALSSLKTQLELEKIRQACGIAKKAYEFGVTQIRAGRREPEVAELFRAPLCTTDVSGRPTERRDGFAFCMSGPNSAKAYAAYARTRNRALELSDLVMMHCNSYVDGFWTDITRTYTFRPPDNKQKNMYAAVFAAREAALAVIKPGIRAREVDAAARLAIQRLGLGKYLKHGTGHGVGLSPMSAYSIPRIHDQSPDVLQQGMVFNVEPALYVEGYGGVRHCDMVAVTSSGYELLTDFHSDVERLALTDSGFALKQSIRPVPVS